MKRLLALLALLSALPMQAATYYVDCNAPDDRAPGTSPANAWKTIDKVNRSTFSPDDSVLFNRGCTWREQLVVPSSGSAGHPITFGAYGSGANPTINGSTLITPGTAWSQKSATVWSTTLATVPEVLFIDGAHIGKRKASLGALGAECDWYHDGATTLYLYSVADPDTAYTSPGVEWSYETRGIFSWLRSYITVQDLNIERTACQSILNIGGKGWTVTNVRMSYAWGEGMRNWGNDVNTPVDDLTVTGCTISYTGGEGIYAGNFGKNGVVRENSIDHACLNPDLDTTGGIKIWSGLAGSNDPDNVSGWLIEKNSVHDCGDGTGNRGAGIWCDTSNSNIVRYNRVHDNQLIGIMIEKGTSNQVYGNVVYNHTADLSGNGGRGIMLSMDVGEEQCNDNLIYNNTVYNSRQSLVVWGAGSTHSISNNLIKNNIFLTSSEDDISYRPQGRDSGNVFAYNCLGPNNIKVTWNGFSKTTYAAWETAYGGTTHSVQSDPSFTNVAGGDFTLRDDSPCIDAGADLGPLYSTALVPGSSWPSNVLTGDQYHAGQWWEIGAYLFPASGTSTPTPTPTPNLPPSPTPTPVLTPTATPTPPTSPPEAPTGVSASDGTYSDRVRVIWNASAAATGYKVFRNASNSPGSAAQIGTSIANFYDDASAVAGTTYFYWVTATNSMGGSSFSSPDTGYLAAATGPTPTLTPTPTPPPGGLAASFTVSPDTPTQGEPVQFTDTSTGATTWDWDFGDGTRSMGRNPVHTYAARGTYTVVLWVGNGVSYSQAVKTVTTATLVRKHLPKR
jgi:parallel beta-helix repeat protein